MVKFFALIVAALCAVNAFAEKSSGTCPGGHDNGDQFNQGRYWYECKDGQVVPKGCLSDSDTRIEIDATFDTKQYRMKCIKGSDGFLTAMFQACMYQGAEHDVGAQWDDGTALYTCVQEGKNVRVITLGCVDQGRPLKIDERVAKGDFIYQCRKNPSGTPTMNKVGCVLNGKKFNIGETFDGPKSWYTCTDQGPQAAGCVFNGNRFQWNDAYDQDDVRYNCKVHEKDTEFVPAACLQRDNGAVIERKIGCFWMEGDYEYTCKNNGNNKATKVPTQCMYFTGGSGAGFKIRPGCVQEADGMVIGCMQNGDSLSMKTYKPNDSLPAGLRKC
jgi:hypothetical protein